MMFGLVIDARESFAQAQLDTSKREVGSHSFIPEDLVKNIHASYSVSYMGPYLSGGGPGTYNIYLNDVASTQLYHSIRVGYQVDEALQIGIAEDIVNNLETVMSPSGRTSVSSFEQYDPYVYFNFPKFFELDSWSIFTSASFSLPLSNASKIGNRLTNLVFSQVWTYRGMPSRWKGGFRYYLNPIVYAGPRASGAVDRQTFYASFGHFLNYELSRSFSLTSSTHFDTEHRSPTQAGFFELKRSLPDFFQLGALYTADVAPALFSVGLYVQSLFWAPTLNTSIIGGNLSIGF
jgi:hypothetical protein